MLLRTTPLFRTTPQLSDRFWAALDAIPTQTQIPYLWRVAFGEDYEFVKNTFLQPQYDTPVLEHPCTREPRCGCRHEIIRHTPTEVLAVCNCRNTVCADLSLKPDDVVWWTLDRPKLNRAVAQALDVEPKRADLGLGDTRQIGSWSTEAVPIIFMLPNTSLGFRNQVTQLVARFRKPFILLTPTTRHIDATSQELLHNVGAAAITLQTRLLLTHNGTFQCTTTPGELFAKFTPEPKDDVNENFLKGVYSFVERLDSESNIREAPVLSVFRLYCIQNLSAVQIAKRLYCSKGTVINRLRMIREKIGMDPDELRAQSEHLSKIDDALSDSRAKSIYRRGAIYGTDESDDSHDS